MRLTAVYPSEIRSLEKKSFAWKNPIMTLPVPQFLAAPQQEAVFSAVDSLGNKFSVLKSAVQKGVRRGEFESAAYAVLGMMDFELASVEAIKKNKISNLLNRLVIIAMEDCSPDLSVIAFVWRMVNEYRTLEATDYLGKALRLLSAVKAMCEAVKARVPSWVKNEIRLNNPPELRGYKALIDLLEEKTVKDEKGKTKKLPRKWKEVENIIRDLPRVPSTLKAISQVMLKKISGGDAFILPILCRFYNDTPAADLPARREISMVTEEEILPLLQRKAAGEVLKFGDHVYDMHCTVGRTRATADDKRYFDLVASAVNNPWPKLLEEPWQGYVSRYLARNVTATEIRHIPWEEIKLGKKCAARNTGRPMAFFCEFEGEPKVVKHLNLDEELMKSLVGADKLKEVFGLVPLNISFASTDHILVSKSADKGTWEEMEAVPKDCHIGLMDVIPGDNMRDLFRAGKKLSDYSEEQRLEYFQIGFFRYIVGITDFGRWNVMIRPDGRLVGIDENSVGTDLPCPFQKVSREIMEEAQKLKSELVDQLRIWSELILLSHFEAFFSKQQAEWMYDRLQNLYRKAKQDITLLFPARIVESGSE